MINTFKKRHLRNIKSQEIFTIEDLINEITNMNKPIFIIAEGGVGKTFFSQKVLIPKLDQKWKLIRADEIVEVKNYLIIDAFDEIPFNKALEIINAIVINQLKVVLLSRPEFSEKKVYDYFNKFQLINDDGLNPRIESFDGNNNDMFSAVDSWLSKKQLSIFLLDFASILSFELLSEGLFSISENLLFEKIRIYNINNNTLLTVEQLVNSELFSWKDNLNIKIENKSLANFLVLKFLRKFNGMKNAFINTVKTKTLSLQLKESGTMLMESNWKEKNEMIFNLIFENRYIEMFTIGYKKESGLAQLIKDITTNKKGKLEKWIWTAQSILINAENPTLISIHQIADEFDVDYIMDQISNLNSVDFKKVLCFWISQKLQSWYLNKQIPSNKIMNLVQKNKDIGHGRDGYRVKFYAIANSSITDEIFEENNHLGGPMEVALIYAIKNRKSKFISSFAKKTNEIKQRLAFKNSLVKEDFDYLFSLLRKLNMQNDIAEILSKIDWWEDLKLRDYLIEENIFKIPKQMLFVFEKFKKIEMSQKLKIKGLHYLQKYYLSHKGAKKINDYCINNSFSVKDKVKINNTNTSKDIDYLNIKSHIKHLRTPKWMFNKAAAGAFPRIENQFIIKNHVYIKPNLQWIKKWKPTKVFHQIHQIDKLYQLCQKNIFFKIENIHPIMFLMINNIKRNRENWWSYDKNQKDWWSHFKDIDIQKYKQKYFCNVEVLNDLINIIFFSTDISKYIIDGFNNQMNTAEINVFIDKIFNSRNFHLQNNDIMMKYIYKNRENILNYKKYIKTIEFDPKNGNHLISSNNIILTIMIQENRFNRDDLLNIIQSAFETVKKYRSYGGGTIYWWNNLFFNLGDRGEGLYHFMRHAKHFGLLREYLKMFVETFKYRVARSNDIDREIYEALVHFTKISGFYSDKFNPKALIEEIADGNIDSKDMSVIWENVMKKSFIQEKTHFSIKMFYKHMNSIFSTHEFIGIFENNVLNQILTIVKNIKYNFSAKENIFHSAITANIQNYVYEEFGFLYIQEANPRNMKFSKKSIDFMIINVLDFICVELKTIDDDRLSIKKSEELFEQLKSYSKNQFLSTINYLIVIYNQKTIDLSRYKKINNANEIAVRNNFKMVMIDRDKLIDKNKIDKNIIIVS